MQALKNESPPDPDLATFNPPHAQAELDYWERLIFSFDMDREPSGSRANPKSRDTRRSRSVSQPSTAATGANSGSNRLTSQDHDVLAQFAPTAASGLPQPGGLGHPHDSYELLAQSFRGMQGQQGHYPYIPATSHFPPSFPPQGTMGHPPPQAPHNYGWPQQSSQHNLQTQYDFQQRAPQYNPASSQFPYAVSPQQQLPPINTNTSSRARAASTSQPIVSAASSTSPSDTTNLNEDGTAMSEDKRRRNTAASARFRIKKKQRSLNLERSVSDLAGRAEELEREASELRRENGWLKEIVMLKGRSLSGAGERSRASRGDKDSDSEDQSEESEAGEASAASKKKGKGKGRDKSNK